jgi:hypothetical protein
MVFMADKFTASHPLLMTTAVLSAECLKKIEILTE